MKYCRMENETIIVSNWYWLLNKTIAMNMQEGCYGKGGKESLHRYM